MRGFVLGALVLVGLDAVLKAPGTRVAQLVSAPAAWLAEWCDPRRPLISGSASTSAAGAGGSIFSKGSVPSGHKPDKLGEGGSCPAAVIAAGYTCAAA